MRTLPVLVVLALAAAVVGLAPSSSRTDAEEGQAAAQVTGVGGSLETSILVEKLVLPDGAVGNAGGRWVPARRLSAGDQVHYTVRVHNPGKTPVSDIVVTKRLPFGVRYEPGSATGPACEIELSADGGRSFARPEPSGGRQGQQAAPTPQYTHVRWVMSRPLAPGATALLRFRATFS
jgi:uncharacterized repeat protein (TIGR01451 family)